MTSGRFYFARLLHNFGFDRKAKRMRDAASELHLMQEGEELLGFYCWKGTEHIEDLALEYWQLRKIETARRELKTKIAEAEETLQTSHTERVSITDLSREATETRRQKLVVLDAELAELAETREEILARAQAVRRRHDSLKAKLAVLEEDGDKDSEECEKTRQKSEDLRQTFADQKEEQIAIDEKINSTRTQTDTLREHLFVEDEGTSEKTRESFSVISQVNRQITRYRADLGAHNQEASRLHRIIGRYLSLNHHTSPECREAVGTNRTLVVQTNLLRQSMAYNHRLAEEM